MGTLDRTLRHYFTALQRLREEELPYLTRYLVTAQPVPRPLKTSDFPGLLFVHIADPNGETEVTAYWRSRELAVGNAAVFTAAVGATSIKSEGYLRHLTGPKKPLWRRVTVGTWLLYAASILGAFAVVQTYFAKSFERPDIGRQIAGPKVLNVLSSNPIRFDLVLTNRSRDVASVVTLYKPLITRAGKTIDEPFQADFRPAPISPASTITVPFEGDPLPADTYTVTVSMKAKTGRVPKRRPYAVTKQVRVWQLEPETPLESVESLENPFGAQMFGYLFVGKAAPHGLKCKATLKKAPTVSIRYVDFPGVQVFESLPPVRTPGLERTSAKFDTSQPFESLTKYRFSLTLESTAVGINWKAMKGNASVVCVVRDIPETSKQSSEGSP